MIKYQEMSNGQYMGIDFEDSDDCIHITQGRNVVIVSKENLAQFTGIVNEFLRDRGWSSNEQRATLTVDTPIGNPIVAQQRTTTGIKQNPDGSINMSDLPDK